MIKFENLEFKPHRIIKNAVQALVKLEDGSLISIVGGPGLYGNGVTSFEMMSNRTNVRGDVRGWLSKEQITQHLKYVQKNPLK